MMEVNSHGERLQWKLVAIAVGWSVFMAPASVAQTDSQLIIPPAPVLNTIPNRSGDPANPLRYLDRYGLPGSGPVPGVTLGYPLEQEKAATPPAAAGAVQAPGSSPSAAGQPVGSVSKGAGADKQGAQQKAAQAAKKKAPAGTKGVNKEVAISEGQPTAPPAPEHASGLREASLMLAAGEYDQALKEIEKVLSVDKENASAHYLKAVICVYQRDFARAAAEYDEVLRLAPGSELARRALEGLKKL